MKCQECELLLEEYIDGETDERATATVAAHLKACAACAEAYDGLTAEQSLYAAYERDVEVTPELWGGIEARLRADVREAGGKVGFLQRLSRSLAPLLVAPRFSPALTAALVAFAILATAVVMRSLDPRGAESGSQMAQAGRNESAAPPVNSTPNAPTQSETPSQSASPTGGQQPAASPGDVSPRPEAGGSGVAAGGSPKKGIKVDRSSPPAAAADGAAPRVQQASLKAAQPTREPAADRLVREAEQRYVAAIRILERDVSSRRSKLDRETLARFDETLASIDRTIAETRKSARQHGNDPVAVQYMLSAYAKKVEVMREMAHIGQGN